MNGKNKPKNGKVEVPKKSRVQAGAGPLKVVAKGANVIDKEYFRKHPTSTKNGKA